MHKQLNGLGYRMSNLILLRLRGALPLSARHRLYCRHHSEGSDDDCVHVCRAMGPVLGLETVGVVVLLLVVLMVWVGEMKIGRMDGRKGGRGRGR